MPEAITTELWQLIPTFIYFIVGIVFFGASLLLMERVTPFSMRKEIEEDQNVALGVVIAGALIAIAILLAAVIK